MYTSFYYRNFLVVTDFVSRLPVRQERPRWLLDLADYW